MERCPDLCTLPMNSKRRTRFGKRLSELHEQQEADAFEARELAASVFLPTVIVGCLAAIAFVETLLRPILRGREHLIAGVLVLVALGVGVVWWRRQRR